MKTDHTFRTFLTGDMMLRIVLGFFITLSLNRFVTRINILERFSNKEKRNHVSEILNYLIQFLISFFFIYLLYRFVILSRPRHKKNNQTNTDFLLPNIG